ncbi:MAG: hypothetical protein WCC80_22215 [Pseudolabrys sp.]
MKSILSFFRKKYRDKAIDVVVVVVVGSSALDFVSRRRGELWPNVPVVFAAIDEATIAKVTLPPNVTGVTMQLTLQDMVRTATIVVPDLKRIAIVGDPLDVKPSIAISWMKFRQLPHSTKLSIS